jgi:hypothetical protein
MAKYGRETNDTAIRARQQRDLDKASKMMEEDRNPETRKKYTADQLKERLNFMTDAMRNAESQRKYDAEVADKPQREAADEFRRETRGGKPPELSGFGPKLTFLTPERLAKSREAMGGMKKGGKVKSASARADGIAIRGRTRA